MPPWPTPSPTTQPWFLSTTDTPVSIAPSALVGFSHTSDDGSGPVVALPAVDVGLVLPLLQEQTHMTSAPTMHTVQVVVHRLTTRPILTLDKRDIIANTTPLAQSPRLCTP